MSNPDRIRYLLDHSFGKSVVTINFRDWDSMVRHDGHPTTLEKLPDEISGVMKQAEVVVAVIANPTPGIDIVRRDPRDAPFVYNTDHYTVVEKLTAHPHFMTYLQRAGVDDSPQLRQTLDSWIWIIGPEKDPELHWSEEIPDYIRSAENKTEQAGAVNPCPSGTCKQGYLTADVRFASPTKKRTALI